MGPYRRNFSAIPILLYVRSLGERRSVLGRIESSQEVASKVSDGNSNLLGGVAVSQRHTAIFQRFEVDGDAPWRANFVLAAIALTNGLRDVIVTKE